MGYVSALQDSPNRDMLTWNTGFHQGLDPQSDDEKDKSQALVGMMNQASSSSTTRISEFEVIPEVPVYVTHASRRLPFSSENFVNSRVRPFGSLRIMPSCVKTVVWFPPNCCVHAPPAFRAYSKVVTLNFLPLRGLASIVGCTTFVKLIGP